MATCNLVVREGYEVLDLTGDLFGLAGAVLAAVQLVVSGDANGRKLLDIFSDTYANVLSTLHDRGVADATAAPLAKAYVGLAFLLGGYGMCLAAWKKVNDIGAGVQRRIALKTKAGAAEPAQLPPPPAADDDYGL